MDFDGRPLADPDLSTRGMLVADTQGTVTARYYVDVYPALTVGTPAGAATVPAGGAIGAGDLLLLVGLAMWRRKKLGSGFNSSAGFA
jgi:hypothetical protein